jgi:hypothetical protein
MDVTIFIVTYSTDAMGSQSIFTEKLPTSVTINNAATLNYTYSVGWFNITDVPAFSTIKLTFVPTQAGVSPANFYFLSYTHTVNNVTGYGASRQSGWTSQSAHQTFSGNGTVTFAFQAWLIHSDSEPNEPLIGDQPTAVLIRTVDGEGMQNASVAALDKSLVIGMNAIEIVVYVNFNGGEYLRLATFVSDRLVERELVGGTWTFDLYTKVSSASNTTTATAYWGDQTYKSGIGSVYFIDPLPQEVALNSAMNGDFVSAILYPFTYIIGDIFYALIFIAVLGNLHLRYKRIEIIVIFFLLWGGSSGIGLLIPVIAYRIIYIILLLGIAAVLYRVFR